MASSGNSVWAIDIGSSALKALRLTQGEDGLEVIGFDYIEHSSILSSEDIEPGERSGIIAKSMHIFASRNDVDDDKVAISVAGHNSFARFIKLPPVESKRIPEIVQFEAVQQIPFDINEVEWDWQLMENPESSETEVGLFAIKNDLIAELMGHFAEEGMQVGHVQISPMALHNYANYDRSDIGSPKEKATVILDMGAENTTLVVCTKNTVWQRSIRIGGNTFTEAIQDKFDISFTKAEKHKRAALMSKYVRQIFSAMKPIYTDLGSEVQRSLGFYASSGPGRDKGFSKIIAIGGGMKLKGVAKYLQQTLGIPVEKLTSLNRVKLASGLSEAKFHANLSDYIIAYGLGVQVLDDDPAIKSNLLPRKIIRAMEWARKAKVLTVAASIFLLISVLGFGRFLLDSSRYSSADPDRKAIARVVSDSRRTDSDYESEKEREKKLDASISKAMGYYSYCEVIPDLAQTILSCLPNADNTKDPEQKKVHEAFSSGNIYAIKSIPREDRKQLFITAMTIDYTPMVSTGSFRDIKSGRSMRKARTVQKKDMAGAGAYNGMQGDLEGYGGQGGYGGGKSKASVDDGTPKEKDGPGFVVTIEGYSPYKEIGDLLDPTSVGSKRENWGIVTKFENISKLIKGCPFEFYIKNDTNHFRQIVGEVEYGDNNVPGGIGEVKDIQRIKPPEVSAVKGRKNAATGGVSETVLIDPMTKEEMGKTKNLITQQDIDSDPSLDIADLGKVKIDDLNGDREFIVRDHWFRINAKFLWKDAPTTEE